MLTEALGLALLAAITPTALLVAAVFLGSANPHRTVLFYLAGAIVMTAVIAIVVFIVLRAGHLYKPRQHAPRYGVRLGLGLILLLLGGYYLRRGPRTPKPPKPPKPGKKPKQGGIITRLTERPRPWTAFLVGILVYSPSVTFIAAVQTVATSKEDVAQSALALGLIIAVTLLFIWVPFGLFLLAPERTSRLLHSFNAWLRGHGHQLVVVISLGAGALLTLDGILGLTGVVT
jgi:Sap-like sulfolipid-1-addressing protein